MLGDYAQSIEQAAKLYEGKQQTATPYITKVANHWYRNQYFIKEEQDIEEQKRRLNSMMAKVYAYLNGLNPGDVDSNIINDIGSINNLEDTAGMLAYIEGQKKEWTSKTTDEDIIKKMENEFDAAKKEIEANISGIAYKVDSNLGPIFYEIVKPDELSEEPKVQSFLSQLYVKEERDTDIIQIHNPLFEDNSQYVRKMLEEKYYTFGTEKKSEEETTTKTILNDEKMAEGKQYINGIAALEKINAQIQKCSTDRQDILYMLRDLKELFEDYEFDLENTETVAQKVLDNVMPSYKPYTPWPSVYEKSENTCTKMIYKTSGSANIVSPAKGFISRVTGETIEITFTEEEIETAGMIFHIKAENGDLSPEVSVGDEVERGQVIGSVSPEDGMIILRLNLFTATKQLVKVEDYMTVESVKYDTLSDNEKLALYSLQESEVEVKEEGGILFWGWNEISDTILQRYALMNIVFNRIASPYYKECNSVLSVLSNPKEADFLKYKQTTKTIETLEKNSNAKYAIINALSGVDVTKTGTLIGATRYFGAEGEYYKDIGEEKEKECLEEIESLRIKMQVMNRIFGITEEEYRSYLKWMLEKKIDEVIYQINIAHNEPGTESVDGTAFLQFKDKFDEVKETIILPYYIPNGKETFLKECSVIEPPEGADIVTEVVKGNIITGKPDEEGKITDEFTLIVNSNYTVKWKFSYQIGAEGKIISDIKVEHQAIMNY